MRWFDISFLLKIGYSKNIGGSIYDIIGSRTVEKDLYNTFW